MSWFTLIALGIKHTPDWNSEVCFPAFQWSASKRCFLIGFWNICPCCWTSVHMSFAWAYREALLWRKETTLCRNAVWKRRTNHCHSWRSKAMEGFKTVLIYVLTTQIDGVWKLPELPCWLRDSGPCRPKRKRKQTKRNFPILVSFIKHRLSRVGNVAACPMSETASVHGKDSLLL